MTSPTPDDRGRLVRRRRNAPEIPIGLRPAPSDDELETNVLERWQGWGLILTLFMALFLPAYWLFFEPARATTAGLEFREESIERGEHVYAVAEPGSHGFQAGCAQCHGARAEGGTTRFIPPGSKPGTQPQAYPVPPLNDIFKRQIVDQKKTPRDAYRFVYQTIAQGRPGTPMPTWGMGYGGPMNDQQIEDVINYLISLQVNLPEGTKLAVGASRGGFSRLIAFGAESLPAMSTGVRR